VRQQTTGLIMVGYYLTIVPVTAIVLALFLFSRELPRETRQSATQ